MDVPQNRRSGRSCCRSCHSNGSCNCCHVAVAFAAANVHFHFMLHLAFTSRCALTLVPCPRPQYRSPNISLSHSLSWAQEQRIHLVITWHLNGSGRYQSPVYLNSSHMLLKTGSILQRCPLGERDRRQLPRFVYLLRVGLGLGLTAFLHASVDLIRFLL